MRFLGPQANSLRNPLLYLTRPWQTVSVRRPKRGDIAQCVLGPTAQLWVVHQRFEPPDDLRAHRAVNPAHVAHTRHRQRPDLRVDLGGRKLA